MPVLQGAGLRSGPAGCVPGGETNTMKVPQPEEQNRFESYEQLFLPSFCDVRMVFAVVVIAELLAFILTLVSPGVMDDPWGNLGLISVLMQWIALTSAALLCVCRPVLSRMSNPSAAIISYLLVLVVTAVVAELAFRLMVTSTLFPAIDSGQHAVFMLRSLTISTVVAAVVLRYLYVQFQWRQQMRAEARARIHALQARINPHFLFNSMNTIAALTRSEPAVAETAIEDLSDLFRASLNSTHEHSTLGDELTLARRYLNIESLRLGERLAVTWDMGTVPMDIRVPPLVLQPLLENAIYHGIEPLPEGGTIEVTGRYQNDLLEITISNPTRRVKPDTAGGGNRIAQENIRQRLKIAFGGRAGLDVQQGDESYQVTIRFPGVNRS
jgi:two-component system sensor histidine kinase AlgZ